MLLMRDNVSQSLEAMRTHKLRASLTILGLTMGVATLIAVMTLVQGANLYVEQKIAALGTNVFQVARSPFAATDFDLVIKSLKFKRIERIDMDAVGELCRYCEAVGATAVATGHVRLGEQELVDVSIGGATANMGDIDTRTIEQGRFLTPSEESRAAHVCLIGQTIRERLLAGTDPLGRVIRIDNEEYTIIGVYEKMGSVLGQDQDNFVMVPLSAFLRTRGPRTSLMLSVKTSGSAAFDRAQDEVRQVLRARRHITYGRDEDFFIGTKDSYMSLWASISGAFFAVFIMVSAVSAVVGGVVIMNVMLVSVTERTKEIGIRRALGATQQDILRQFLTESVMQCLVGGAVGILGGFFCALALRTLTSFPASVQTWVAVMGFVLSSAIGLFFGIYPAMRASRLDPVVALRAD